MHNKVKIYVLGNLEECYTNSSILDGLMKNMKTTYLLHKRLSDFSFRGRSLLLESCIGCTGCTGVELEHPGQGFSVALFSVDANAVSNRKLAVGESGLLPNSPRILRSGVDVLVSFCPDISESITAMLLQTFLNCSRCIYIHFKWTNFD